MGELFFRKNKNMQLVTRGKAKRRKPRRKPKRKQLTPMTPRSLRLEPPERKSAQDVSVG